MCENDDEETELACVGSGLGGGFENNAAMTYNLAIKTANKHKWDKGSARGAWEDGTYECVDSSA